MPPTTPTATASAKATCGRRWNRRCGTSTDVSRRRAPPGRTSVKTNTFVTDFDEFQKCADIRMGYLGVATPTSTTVGVTHLAGPDFMIEIEAVAVVNS
jgi:hypothetical protein